MTIATTPKATVRAGKAQKAAEARLKLAQKAANLFKQVSDATRLQVVLILDEGEQHVGAMCQSFRMGQAAVSHHLALLRHGGIIVASRRGKNSFYGLTEKGEALAKIVKTVIA